MKGKQLIINVPKLEHNSFCMLATNELEISRYLENDYKNKKHETVLKYTVRVVDVTALM